MVGRNDEELDPAADGRRVWWLDGGALAWSVGLIAVGLAISTPANVAQNAKGTIITTGGTSLLVPFGALALGTCIIVTQITAREGASARFMPIAWVFAAGLAIVSVIAVVQIGPTLMPAGAALVAGCYYARRRTQATRP